jgi:6-phosphogluconate dehydrogenase (decarboxylating)
MKVGLVGLGRMGAGMDERLKRGGYEVSRFASRDDRSYGMRLIAALRNEFGGHEVHTS